MDSDGWVSCGEFGYLVSQLTGLDSVPKCDDIQVAIREIGISDRVQFKDRFVRACESITRNTVKAILKRNGYDIGPERGPGTWDEFVKRHAKTLWQCDFFSKKIVSKMGLRDIFFLVFLNVKTRQVYITPSTYKPDQAWMIEQAEAFIKHTQEEKMPCKIVMHDNDGKYSKPFLDVFKNAKIKPGL